MNNTLEQKLEEIFSENPHQRLLKGESTAILALSNPFFGSEVFDEKAWKNLSALIKKIPEKKSHYLFIVGGLIPQWKFHFTKKEFNEPADIEIEDNLLAAEKHLSELPESLEVHYFYGAQDMKTMEDIYSKNIDTYSRQTSRISRDLNYIIDTIDKTKKIIEEEEKSAERKLEDKFGFKKIKKSLANFEARFKKAKNKETAGGLKKKIAEKKAELRKIQADYAKEAISEVNTAVRKKVSWYKYDKRIKEKITSMQSAYNELGALGIQDAGRLFSKYYPEAELKIIAEAYSLFDTKDQDVLEKFLEKINIASWGEEKQGINGMEKKLQAIREEHLISGETITKRALPEEFRIAIKEATEKSYFEKIKAAGKKLKKFFVHPTAETLNFRIGGNDLSFYVSGLIGTAEGIPLNRSVDKIRDGITTSEVTGKKVPNYAIGGNDTIFRLERTFFSSLKEDANLITLGPFFDVEKARGMAGKSQNHVPSAFLSNETTSGCVLLDIGKTLRFTPFKLDNIRFDSFYIPTFLKSDEHEGKSNQRIEEHLASCWLALQDKTLQRIQLAGDWIQALNYAGAATEGTFMQPVTTEQFLQFLDKMYLPIKEIALRSSLKTAVEIVPGNHEKKFFEEHGLTLAKIVGYVLSRDINNVGWNPFSYIDRAVKESGKGAQEKIEVGTIGHEDYLITDLEDKKGENYGKSVLIHKAGEGGVYKVDPVRRIVRFASYTNMIPPEAREISVGHSHWFAVGLALGKYIFSPPSFEAPDKGAREMWRTYSPYGKMVAYHTTTTGAIKKYVPRNKDGAITSEILDSNLLREIWDKKLKQEFVKKFDALPAEIKVKFR